MTARELIETLEQRDVRLAVNGAHLRIDAPPGVVTSELKRDLQERKPELLALIKERNDHRLPATAEIEAMSLESFARAGLKVRVHSQALGCDVLFVSDDVPNQDIETKGLTVYRAHELRKLAVLKPQPHSLRTIHEVKSVFNGTIEEVSHE